MADYISREAAIAEIKDESGCDFCWARTKDMCKTMCHTRKKIARIVAIPAADVRPVVRGKWANEHLASTSGGTYAVIRCSVCKSQFPLYKTNYCPNCGADMRAANDRPYGDEGADCYGLRPRNDRMANDVRRYGKRRKRTWGK